MLKTISFPVDVDIAETSGESSVVFVAEAQTDSGIADIEHIVRAFVTAANVGMFSNQPAASTKPIGLDSIDAKTPGMIRVAWRSNGLQVAAYSVLLNMLEVSHHRAGMLTRVRLASTRPGGTPVDPADLLNGRLSLNAADTPFAFRHRRHLGDCREPVIRLEFSRRVSDDDLPSIMAPFQAWDAVVVRGGYLKRLNNRNVNVNVEEALASQQTYLASPDTVEHLFYKFAGGEAAFVALLNMCTKLHSVFCPLASLEVE